MVDRVWTNGNLFATNGNCWECKLMQPLWRTIWRFLERLGINLPFDPTIPPLGISLEETITEKEACTLMFSAALFTIARKGKQPRCPSTDDWVKKLWHMYTMEYYSAIERKPSESVLMRWIKIESIIQSKSEREKQ